jgi:hypothetical protein
VTPERRTPRAEPPGGPRGLPPGGPRGLPPGWPRGLPPAGAPDWRRAASGWLLDHCPPDYRGHPVITRHPVALARLAVLHLQGSVQACREATATARAALGDQLPPEALSALLEALEVELARLLAAGRAARLVEQALRDTRQ